MSVSSLGVNAGFVPLSVLDFPGFRLDVFDFDVGCVFGMVVAGRVGAFGKVCGFFLPRICTKFWSSLDFAIPHSGKDLLASEGTQLLLF